MKQMQQTKCLVPWFLWLALRSEISRRMRHRHWNDNGKRLGSKIIFDANQKQNMQNISKYICFQHPTRSIFFLCAFLDRYWSILLMLFYVSLSIRHNTPSLSLTERFLSVRPAASHVCAIQKVYLSKWHLSLSLSLSWRHLGTMAMSQDLTRWGFKLASGWRLTEDAHGCTVPRPGHCKVRLVDPLCWHRHEPPERDMRSMQLRQLSQPSINFRSRFIFPLSNLRNPQNVSDSFGLFSVTFSIDISDLFVSVSSKTRGETRLGAWAKMPAASLLSLGRKAPIASGAAWSSRSTLVSDRFWQYQCCVDMCSMSDVLTWSLQCN